MLLRYPLFNGHQWQRVLLKLAGLLASLVAFEPQHTPPFPSTLWFSAPLPLHTLFHTTLALLDPVFTRSWTQFLGNSVLHVAPPVSARAPQPAPHFPHFIRFHACSMPPAAPTQRLVPVPHIPQGHASHHNLRFQCPVGSQRPSPVAAPCSRRPSGHFHRCPPDCTPCHPQFLLPNALPNRVPCCATGALAAAAPSKPAAWAGCMLATAPPLDTLRAC